MRLGDLDALLDKQESIYMKGHVLFHGVTAYAIENAPTIEPEPLPIVQQLTDELKRTVNERNGLAAIVYKQCNKQCFWYNNGKIESSGCEFINKITNRCMLQEWSGYENENENVRLKEPEDYFVAKAKGGK